MQDPRIVASVLGADYARLDGELAALAAAGVDRIQWDIMDGRFVPNLTFGVDVVAACRASTDLPFEAHLMVEEPDRWIGGFAGAGCDTVIVHEETCTHLHRTLAAMREAGVRAGVALNPATPLESIRSVLHQVDLLLVMTVNPGFAGQAYIAEMEDKIREARALIDTSELAILIEVDGGISSRTAPGARSAGADLFVAGSAILGDPEGKAAAVSTLRRALQGAPTPRLDHAEPAP